MAASTSPHTKRIEAGETHDLLLKTRLRYSNALSATVDITMTIVSQIASATGALGLGRSPRTRIRLFMSGLRMKKWSLGDSVSFFVRVGERGTGSAIGDLRHMMVGGDPISRRAARTEGIAPPTMRAPKVRFSHAHKRRGVPSWCFNEGGPPGARRIVEPVHTARRYPLGPAQHASVRVTPQVFG